MSRKATQKQHAFAMAYLETGKPSESYRTAGSPPRSEIYGPPRSTTQDRADTLGGGSKRRESARAYWPIGAAMYGNSDCSSSMVSMGAACFQH